MLGADGLCVLDMASGAMIEIPQELDKGMKYKFRAMADFKF